MILNAVRRTVRFRSVESGVVPRHQKTLAARVGNQLRLKLVVVGFPKKRITRLRAPLAGRLTTLDFKVQMRPAAAGPFLAQQTNFCPPNR